MTPPPSLLCGFSRSVFSQERVKPCFFCGFNYYHKSHLSWKFHWNSSSCSEDMKIFSFIIDNDFKINMKHSWLDSSAKRFFKIRITQNWSYKWYKNLQDKSLFYELNPIKSIFEMIMVVFILLKQVLLFSRFSKKQQ